MTTSKKAEIHEIEETYECPFHKYEKSTGRKCLLKGPPFNECEGLGFGDCPFAFCDSIIITRVRK